MSYVLLLVMLTSITVYQIVVAGFPHCKVTLFLLVVKKYLVGRFFLRLCKYSPSQYFLASNKNYPTSCQTVVLYFHWNSILRKTFLSSLYSSPIISLFSIIHFYQYGLMDIYFILCVLIHWYHFVAQIVLDLSMKSFSNSLFMS